MACKQTFFSLYGQICSHVHIESRDSYIGCGSGGGGQGGTEIKNIYSIQFEKREAFSGTSETYFLIHSNEKVINL